MREGHIPKHLSRKAKRRSVGVTAAALVVCFMLAVILAGSVIGRYQRQLRTDNAARALEFYFTSDFLDGSTRTLAPGSTEVKFSLGNYADELRWSEVNIDYKVTVEPADGVTSVDSVTVAYGSTNHKFGTDAPQDHTVTITGLKPGTYIVKATGTGGYSKTLTATLEVPSEGARLYWHLDNVPGEYTLLTVWNEGDTKGTVTIEYKGIPDNTNPNMGDWVTGGDPPQTKQVEIEPHASMVFRFFDGADITTDAADKEPY